MKFKIYNTLTKEKEIFEPIEDNLVKLYTCGPTVYGPSHLGHARSYINADLIKRSLLYNGFKVKHVMNITDVHDSMIEKANELGISAEKLANRYIPLFEKDLKDLNTIDTPHHPRVTEYIDEIIEMIKAIIDKDYAYVEDDGSVYFKTAKFSDYGKLSGIELKETKTGTRVETDKYEKEEVIDFALWKAAKEKPNWDSPWGKGRPGWHIECSVMAKELLGDTIDIHFGGLDLKFPHHENEIAQSEVANSKKFSNYWAHGGLLDVNGTKMSKSLGNFIEIPEIRERGFDLLALRYLYLTVNYRSPINFTWESLEASQTALEKLRNQLAELPNGKINEKYRKKFLNLINDDLATPQALALIWDILKDENIKDGDKKATILNFDKVLGLGLDKVKEFEIPKKIKKLSQKRESLREDQEFEKADKIRKEVKKLGYIINDTKGGPEIRPNG